MHYRAVVIKIALLIALAAGLGACDQSRTNAPPNSDQSHVDKSDFDGVVGVWAPTKESAVYFLEDTFESAFIGARTYRYELEGFEEEEARKKAIDDYIKHQGGWKKIEESLTGNPDLDRMPRLKINQDGSYEVISHRDEVLLSGRWSDRSGKKLVLSAETSSERAVFQYDPDQKLLTGEQGELAAPNFGKLSRLDWMPVSESEKADRSQREM